MSLTILLNGVGLATFAASGLFFFKFWRVSRDRFNLFFCFTCLLLATERVMLFVVDDASHSIRTETTEATSWVYVFRLLAFIFIAVAVADKNFHRRKPDR